MNHRLFPKIAICAVILLVSAGLALGQAGRGKARLGGTVVDKDGKPIVGAKVSAVFVDGGGAPIETTADKKGEWAFLGLGTGHWQVTASAQGYLSDTVDVQTRQFELNPKITFKLDKPKAGSGIIQDEATFQVLEEGNAFFKDGKYDTALTMYEDFLSKNPGAYQVLLNIGDCYREKGEYDKALEKYDLLLGQAEADSAMGTDMKAKGLAAIGLTYLKQEKFAESQDYFKRSIEVAPQDETLPYNVAEICFSNQQIDDAIHYFELASQIKADWPDPYLRVAFAYLNKGDNAKAAENLEKFIKLEPGTERTAQAQAILDAIKK